MVASGKLIQSALKTHKYLNLGHTLETSKMTTRQVNSLKSLKMIKNYTKYQEISMASIIKWSDSPWWPVGNRSKCTKTHKNCNLGHIQKSSISTTRQANPFKFLKMIKNYAKYQEISMASSGKGQIIHGGQWEIDQSALKLTKTAIWGIFRRAL